MFQSRRFWFSYRLRVVGEVTEVDAEEAREFVFVVEISMLLVVLTEFDELTSS